MRCQFCGGDVYWTLDHLDDVWFICRSSCEGFNQMELFPMEGVPSGMRGDDTDAATKEPVSEGVPPKKWTDHPNSRRG